MYAMLCTCPDIAYALSVASRYHSNLGEAHWVTAKNILKYFRRTKDKFLVYGGEEELVVNGYTDASFQTDKDDFRSQSGFVFCLNGGEVSRKSSKQETVADFMMEDEYIAASEVAKEVFGSKSLFLSWVLFLVRPVQWTSIVIIAVPLHKLRSLDHTKSPNTYCGAITLSLR
jgi:hypothetical protein